MREKALNTIAKNTLLNGSEIWDTKCMEEIEKSHLGYFKNVLHLGRSTHGYMIRQELGLIY